jgi:hypothetical protein
MNEAETRTKLINHSLEQAGWNLNDRTQLGFEIPVDGYDADPWNGVTTDSSSQARVTHGAAIWKPSGNKVSKVSKVFRPKKEKPYTREMNRQTLQTLQTLRPCNQHQSKTEDEVELLRRYSSCAIPTMTTSANPMPALGDNTDQPKLRRAETLRLCLKGSGHFFCSTKNWPRWTIDDIGFLLSSLAKNYDQEKIGCPKRQFTKQEVAYIAFWVLYKERPPWPDRLIARMTLKQAKFFQYYLSLPCLGNATMAARLAGYQHPKQRGHELWKKLRRL